MDKYKIFPIHLPREVEKMYEVSKDRNPALVYLAGLSKGSHRTMRQSLEKVIDLLFKQDTDKIPAEFFPWFRLEYQHVKLIRNLLEEEFAPATGNKILAAVRGVMKECWNLGFITGEVYQRIKSVPGIKGNTLPKGRALKPEEIARLVEACRDDESKTGARDRAVIAVLYNCGLRRSEIVALNLEDYDPTEGELRILHSKGNRSRVVFLSDTSKEILSLWLKARGNAPGPLFVRIRKGDSMVFSRLTDQSVFYILQNRASQAGLEGFSPHDFRRTTISTLLDQGVDLATVQQIAGHSSPVTTARYDRRGKRAIKKAGQGLELPEK